MLFPKFQAFLYALIHTAVRSLRSDSGQSMSGAEGLETLSALTFGLRLEVVGTAVSAASRTPLEETTSGEFVTGRIHLFIIRLGIGVSRVARQIFEILSFSQDCLGDELRQPWGLSFAGFC